MKNYRSAGIVLAIIMASGFFTGCAEADAAEYLPNETPVADIFVAEESVDTEVMDYTDAAPNYDARDQAIVFDEPELYEYPLSFAEMFGFNQDYPSNVSINTYLTVVNKRNLLDPRYYFPNDLVEVPGGQSVSARILPDLEALFEAAENDGVPMRVLSGFRSFERQTTVHRNLLNQMGQAALRWSARPGHSEHQTGLAVDLLPAFGSNSCQEFRCFSATPHARWLNENAVNFGFIVRYFDGSEEITGFAYEPWHIRWIGREVASTMKAHDIWTLEELFDLPPAPNYLD